MKSFKSLIAFLILAFVLSACAGAQSSPNAGAPSPASETATTVPPTATPTQTQTSPTATPEGLWISLSPDAGEAGAVVQVQGYLPGGPAVEEAAQDTSLTSATLCWGGCLDGLTFVDQPLTWSESDPGHFTASLNVPVSPYLSADGPMPLTPGKYPVGIQCLGVVEGCALEEAQASAVFELTGPAPARCSEGAPCAELAFSPEQAAPGAPVQVSGWAPLVEVLGGQPFGYSLVLLPESAAEQPLNLGQLDQALDGSLSGTFQAPQQLPGIGLLAPGSYTLALQAFRPQTAGSITLAPTPFEITAGLSWSDLNLGRPLWVEPSASLVEPFTLAVDPGEPQHLAYCAPGAIRVTADGGASWASIPTGPVAELAAGSDYPLFTGGDPGEAACASVTLDPLHPDSFYAVFETQNANFGAPPVFFHGFTTANRGETWQALPEPSADLIEGFGGFWSDRTGLVEALFSLPGFDPAQADAGTVIRTTDGGQTWISDAGLSCPLDGACLRWGPAPGSIPGMGSPLPQPVLYSADGGETWNDTGLTAELRLPGSELAVFADQRALLLTTGGDYPVRLTEDGGQSWQVVNLPAPPGDPGDFPFFQGLVILADGRLLAPSADGSSWLLLSPGEEAWCPVAGAELPPPPVQPRLAGQQLWWLDPASGEPQHIALPQVACASP